MGVDLVGMFMVYEIIVVWVVGVEVLGVFLVINLVVGIIGELLSYVEVFVVGVVLVIWMGVLLVDVIVWF